MDPLTNWLNSGNLFPFLPPLSPHEWGAIITSVVLGPLAIGSLALAM